MKYHNLFSGENQKKKYHHFSSAEFAHILAIFNVDSKFKDIPSREITLRWKYLLKERICSHKEQKSKVLAFLNSLPSDQV